MAEWNYKYGCTECGKYVEVNLKSGFGDLGKFSDNDLPEKLQKICVCPKEVIK